MLRTYTKYFRQRLLIVLCCLLLPVGILFGMVRIRSDKTDIAGIVRPTPIVIKARAIPAAPLQIGGSYNIRQSVIGGGGGGPSMGGNFAVTGIVGQAILGDSNGGSYSVAGGFGQGGCPTVTVSPVSLPAAITGIAYSQTFTQSGGAGAITWSLTGALPNGLTFNAATATLSGTPTQAGDFNLTVRATDANNCFGERAYVLTSAATPVYEADVAPRPNGSGTVVVSDWVQVGRFSVGLDVPAVGSEFQRADCAPRNTFGDGKITVADWVQAGRYSVGLDPVTPVGGPSSTSSLLSGSQLRLAAQTQGRVIRAVNTAFRRGQVGSVEIEFDALGNENAMSFTLNYDAGQMIFLDAVSQERTKEAAIVINSNDASKGRLAIAVALPAGKAFTSGTNRLFAIRFIPTGGEGRSSMEVTFDDSLVERELTNPDAVLLPLPEYIPANVVIDGNSAAIVSAANYQPAIVAPESIAAIFGKDLAVNSETALTDPLPSMLGGSAVKVRDSEGIEREAQLFYASPDQINFLIPKESALGPAEVTVSSVVGAVSTGLIRIVDAAPGIFTTADGMAAANLIRGSDDQQYLVLYGTGWRNLQSEIRVLIDGIEAELLYAGAQGTFAGLDQINILLPREFAGRNMVRIDLITNGKRSNQVKARLQ